MDSKLVIFYNAECSVCTRLKERLEKSAAAAELQFLDANTAELPPGLNRVEVLEDVYIIDDGVVYRAGYAIPRIARRFRSLRSIAPLLDVPPGIWIVRIGYRLLADHRPFFGYFI